jgi:hypothetical protein
VGFDIGLNGFFGEHEFLLFGKISGEVKNLEQERFWLYCPILECIINDT